jgi:uncharacterized protein with HEPN domain
MRDPIELLRDILEAIAAIRRYHDRDKNAFEQDELLQGWFVRNLQIIGEAARGLSDDVRSRAPTVPWSKIIGMRNVLVHGYFDIDSDIVWAAVQHHLPALKTDIQQLLQSMDDDRWKGTKAKLVKRSPRPRQPKKPGRKRKRGGK